MVKKVGVCLLSVMITLPGTGLASTLAPNSTTAGTAPDQTSPIVAVQTNSTTTGTSLAASDVTGPQLVSSTITPGTANVGDTITITAKATDASGVGSIIAHLYNGNTVRDVPLSYDNTNDIWSGTYTVQQDDLDGTWNLGFDMWDTNSIYSSAISDQAIQIVNPGGSTQSPAVTSLQITPQALTVTTEQQINISAKVTNSTNVSHVMAYLSSPSGIYQDVPLTYDSTKDEWTTTYTFGKYAEEGNWSVEVDVTDNSGVTSYGTNGSVQVTNPNADVTGPVIGDISVDKQTVNAGDTVKVTANLSDTGSGVNTAYANLQDSSNPNGGFSSPLTFNATTGLWEANITVPSNEKPGTFTIDVNSSDVAGNYSSKTASQTIDVQNAGDYTAPTVSDFQMSSTTANPGDVITFTAAVADDKSTVSNVYVQLTSSSYHTQTVPLTYDSSLNKYVGKYTVGAYDASGKWDVSVNTQDAANNFGSYNQGSITIDNPNGDSTGPTISTIDLSSSTLKVGDTLTIKVKASDAISGVSSVAAYVAGKTVSLTYDKNSDLWIGNYTVDKHDAPGAATVSVNAADNAGNTNYQWANQTITIDNPDYDNTPPVLDSVDVPATVNGGEDLVITATAHDDKSGISTAYASIQAPGSTYSTSVPLYYDSTSGKYVGKYTIQPNDRPGDWTLTEVSLQDNDGNYAWVPEGKTFTVNNPNADYTAPVVDSVTVSSQTANLGDAVKIKVKAHDDKSGISYMYADLVSQSGRTNNSVPLTYNKTTDEWVGTYFVGVNDPSGDWTVAIHSQDKANNSSDFTSDQTITVVNPDADVAPPTISNVKVSNTTPTVGDKVQITADISDDKSGVSEVHANIYNNGANYYNSKNVTLHYDATTNKWVGTFEVLDSTVPGSMNVDISATDNANNSTTESGSQLFTVSNPNGDYTGPVVNGVSVSSQDVNAGDQVTITADVTDAQSGVAGVTAQVSYLGEVNFKQDSTGKWIAVATVPTNVPDGEMIGINSLTTMDKNGNMSYGAGSTNVSFKVHNPTGDTTAPKLEDLQLSQADANPGDTVQIKAKVTDDQSGVKYVAAYIGDAYGYGNGSGYIEFTYDQASGYWVANYTVGQYVNPANLDINLDVSDNNNNYNYIPTGKYISITSPNQDYTAPVIDSLEVTPSTANVGDEVTIKASVADNESGVSDVGASLQFGNHWEQVLLTYDAAQKKYVGTYKVKANDPSGKWQVDLYATDYYGNESNYYGIFQVNNPDGDVSAPYLDSFTASAASAGVGDTVNFAAKLGDTQSAVKSANITLNTSYGNEITIPLNYDAAKDEWTTSYKIPSYSQEGLFSINVQAEDTNGNQLNEMTDNHLYIQNDNPDKDAPVFGDVTVTPNQATVGDTVEIKATVTDQGSGVQSVTYMPYNPLQGGYGGQGTILTYDPVQNAWIGQYTIQPTDKLGTLMFGIQAKDNAGNTGYKDSNPLEITVKDVTRPSVPTVNQVTDQSTSVTGAADAGSTITVMSGTNVLGTTVADNNGNFSVTIPVQKAGTTLTVTATDNSGKVSDPTGITVKDVTPPSVPTVNQVTDQSTSVTGTAESGSTITVNSGTSVLGTTVTDNDGNFSFAIAVQKVGTNLTVTATDTAGNVSKPAGITVKDVNAPSVPTVNQVTDQSKSVTGTAEAGSTITVKSGTSLLGTAVTDSNGNFSLTIPVQKAGTNLTVTATDTAGNVSDRAEITVKDVTPPSMPTVNPVTDQSTSVTGTAEAGSTITVKSGTSVLGTAVTDNNGNFNFTIPVQKVGTSLTVTATDNAGNVSDPAGITVNVVKLTGWQYIEGKWYYYTNEGNLKKGWLKDGNIWYYLDNNGVMKTGWLYDGAWYYLHSNGAMATGWIKDGNTYYYLNNTGAMKTGWVYDGAWYYLKSSGAMATGWVKDGNSWYYLDHSGAMKTGWVYDGGKWYYLYSNGVMASNTKIGSYKLGADGAWIG